MAKLVYGLNQSLDGYVDHLKIGPPPPALARHFMEQVRGLTGMVYGRRMTRSCVTGTMTSLRRAFRSASKVESQKSCIHPMVSHTTRARPVLRRSPLLSRQNEREENSYN